MNVSPSPSEHPASAHSEALPPSSPLRLCATLLSAAIIVGALYFGRDILVPLALAILLSFALMPLVSLLRRWNFGRVPSVGATVLLAFLVIFGIGAVIGSQITYLAERLPQYQSNVETKIESLRGGSVLGDVFGRATRMLRDLRGEIAAPPVALVTALTPATGLPATPLPVEIHQPDPGPFELIQRVSAPLLRPLTTGGIVIVFVVLFLLQREDLRDRFIRLAGARDLQRTTRALDDAGRRLSRYLVTQTALNASFGFFIGLGLMLIGVPNFLLWGFLAMLLRYVPYIGPVIAAGFPLVLALAAALFLVAEMVTGQILEPVLYGHSTGLSAVAVVIAAAFWTWLWGPVGLLLSTPLTLCLVVLGRYVERLAFLDVALGDRPALSPEEGFYQRVLAGDPDEAADQAEAFLKTRPLSAYYDEVAMKGLALAQHDVNHGTLERQRRIWIRDAVTGVIDDLAEYDDAWPERKEEPEEGEDNPPALPPVLAADDLAPEWRGLPVLCVAGRGALDEAAASMLRQLLDKHGIGARAIASEAASTANLFQLDVAGVQLALLSYLEPGGLTNARYLVRRLRRKLPRARIVLGFWTLDAEAAAALDAVTATGCDAVVNSLHEAVTLIVAAAVEPQNQQPAPARLLAAR
jgi:predicted PurR-regulated permease PerM